MSATSPAIDVFVIHTPGDGTRAARLADALRRHGLRSFSRRDLRPGDVWDVALPAAMARSRALAILISDHWPQPGQMGEAWYAPDEVARAIELARGATPAPRIIPVWLDGAVDRTPYGLRRVIGIHVTGDALVAAAADIAAVVEPAPASGAAEDRAAPADGPLRIGQMFADRYRLEARLGEGGFASVWAVEDCRSGVGVALKILHARWTADEGRVERFRRGAEYMAALSHPSVVRVLAPPAVHRGWHFYPMERLSGGDLRVARTRQRDPLTPGRTLAAILAVADALAALHRRGLVHRDVKPTNILLDAQGQAKLADFDLVRSDAAGARTGELGTFLYCAPEVLAGETRPTPAADVYALGVCAVFALLGRVPPEVMRSSARVLAGIEVSGALGGVLRRALDWEPTRRQPDAGVFAAEVRAALVQPAPPPDPSCGPEAVDLPSAPTRPTPARRWLAVGLAVAVGLGAVMFVVRTVAPSEGRRPLGAQGHPPASERPSGPSGAAETAGARPAGRALDHPPDGFVRVEPGAFEMGTPAEEAGRAPDEGPVHVVRSARPLWVQAHEVTQAEWRALMRTDPSAHEGCDACPVERVNWYEAAAYANALSRRHGLTPCYPLTRCDGAPGRDMTCASDVVPQPRCDGYRLPTEAEWAYFARAGTRTRFWSGDERVDLMGAGWFEGNSGGRTHPVGEKAANPWGLYDVHGNVAEWCQDWFGPYRAGDQGAGGPARGHYRVVRGGGHGDPEDWSRSGRRSRRHPGDRRDALGFRLVRRPPLPLAQHR